MKPYDLIKSMIWALAFMIVAPSVGAVILIVSSEPTYTLVVLYVITMLHVFHTRKPRTTQNAPEITPKRPVPTV